MKMSKGKFFVPNQGSLQPLPEVPLWEDAGGESREDFFPDSPKLDTTLDVGTLEEIKGRERLW
jgi:hypothetical protein